MDQQDQFDRIVASLHEATLDDTHWRHTSNLIDEACGSVGNNLIIFRGDSVEKFEWLFASLHYRGELNEEINRIYPEYYRHIDERLPRMLRLPDSHTIHVPKIYTNQELKTSETYNELLVQARGRNGLNIRLDGGLDGSQIFFIFADPVDPNGWSSDEFQLISRLLPHIRQFVLVRQALVSAKARGLSLASLLGNRRIGAILLDQRGSMIEANARAREILQQNDGLYEQTGVLRARSAADDLRLGQLLAGALRQSGGPPAGGTMRIKRSSPDRLQLVLHATPLVSDEADFGIRVPSVLVLIVDPEHRPAFSPGLGEATLGLTPSESQVASLLAAGRSVRQIAVMTRRKESSVRWLFKQIHAKLGISRQADLVRMIYSVSATEGPGK